MQYVIIKEARVILHPLKITSNGSRSLRNTFKGVCNLLEDPYEAPYIFNRLQKKSGVYLLLLCSTDLFPKIFHRFQCYMYLSTGIIDEISFGVG